MCRALQPFYDGRHIFFLVCKHPDKYIPSIFGSKSHHILCEQKHRLLSQSKKQRFFASKAAEPSDL
jgi:hypothetical protein